MFPAFADNLATMSDEVLEELPTFHAVAPNTTRIVRQIGSSTFAFLSRALGFGNGNASPSSKFHIAISRSARRSMRLAAGRLLPWVMTPGKSSTLARYQ